jgi:hypothetical protein
VTFCAKALRSWPVHYLEIVLTVQFFLFISLFMLFVCVAMHGSIDATAQSPTETSGSAARTARRALGKTSLAIINSLSSFVHLHLDKGPPGVAKQH